MTAFSDYAETAILDALGNNTAYAVATPYLKLHIGDPGETGASNAAAETTRKLVSFGAASSGPGSISNDAAIEWTNVSTTETISHVSLWDHVSAGNCHMKGALAASKALTAGDNFTIPIGDLDLTVA